MKIIGIHKLSYERKKAWVGFLFVLPWAFGALLMFVRPFIETIIYSFCELKITTNGFDKTFIGLDNFNRALFQDPMYVRYLVDSITKMLYQSPSIVIFSLLIACILNQKFRGRIVARAIFFLPVIIASGVVITMLQQDPLSYVLKAGGRSSVMFRSFSFTQLLYEIGIDQQLVNLFSNMAGNVFDLSWKAGIQILLCLAGLQTIPRSMYEASIMEGATAWDSFWKITFPLISPILLVSLIFTITESFIDYSNQVMQLIYDHISDHQDFQYSAAMSMLYFLLVFISIVVVYAIVDKFVVYTEK